MDVVSNARAYLDRIDSAVSGNGGHDQTLKTASILVNGFGLSQSDARPLLLEYSSRCSPPWSEREINHKLSDAERLGDPKGRPKGYLVSAREQHVIYRPSTAPQHMVNRAAPSPKPATVPKPLSPTELPAPMPDGARQLLRTAFKPEEGVRIAQAKLNEENREVPMDGGVALTCADWLKRLDAKDGNPNSIWKSSARTGIYVGVNPMKIGGVHDADVTSFRHALLEFDSLGIGEQWTLYRESNLPCTAVILSGGKSLHAWVRIDAKDRREYDERVRMLYSQFDGYGLDSKNKNPSRLSRLPNCERFSKRQELIALNIGAASFSEWIAEREILGIGETITCQQLVDFKPERDGNSLLGSRWVCKGGSILWVGQSGIGKSSLAMQAAVTWATGRKFFGVEPVKPLKSLIVQAENDMGDMAEMFQGVMAGLGVTGVVAEFENIDRNIIFVRDTSHTGLEFTGCVQKLIERYRPDLVWLDPLLSFIGADISKQEVCSEFLRNWLGPISKATEVAWMMVHHTGKPPTDPKAQRGWQTSDYSYAGLGSSELTNWARGVCVLRQVGDLYELKLAKRGKRAGATDYDGEPTTSVWLSHASTGILWQQMETPENKEEEKTDKVKEPPAHEKIRTLNTSSFLAGCKPEGESQNEIENRLAAWSESKDCPDPSFSMKAGTARKCLDALTKTHKLSIRKEGRCYRYTRGPNA